VTAWKARALEASTHVTGEKLGLAAVLFAAIVGIIQLVKPRLVRMLDREEAALASAAAENIERRELLQQELAAEKAENDRLRALDRESILTMAQLQAEKSVGESRSAQLEAEKALAESQIKKLQADLEDAIERFTEQVSAAGVERDPAVQRVRELEEETSRLRASTVQLRAQVDTLQRGT
jgi:chromosome segregation ATPase